MLQTNQIIVDDIAINIYRKKHIKRLSIKIDPIKGVYCNVPTYLPEHMIYLFLESAKSWLNKHYHPIINYHYIQGEKHPFLGFYYPLNLIEYQTKPYTVLENHQINIYANKLDNHIIQKLLQTFYRKKAYQLFPERLKACIHLTPWVTSIPQLKYRFMRSRYGSCSSLGNISLNIHLIKARIELIDYVILHELCHIKEHNHGPEFYQLMHEVMPNWKKLKEELKHLQLT